MESYKRTLQLAVKKDQKDLEWMMKKNDFYPKAAKASENSRKRGNDLYMQKHHNADIHRQIFKNYCDSVLFAPVESEPLALALFSLYKRQEILYTHYAFECDCEPCIEGWPTILEEEFNEIVVNSPEEDIFKSCENIISRVHDNDEALLYDKKIVKKLSEAILKTFEYLEQPSHLTCLLIKTLILYYQRTLGLQPESFGDCDKFSK